MPVLVLSADAESLRLLRNALAPLDTTCPASDWNDAVRQISSGQPPVAFIIDAAALDERIVQEFTTLARRGVPVPTAVYFRKADSALVARAWPLARCDVECLFEDERLTQALHRLVGNAARAMSAYLIERLELRSGAAEKLIRLLGTSPEVALMHPPQLATACGYSRSGLYDALAHEGLLTPAGVQFLFCLLPAQRILAAGHSVERAAFVAGYADARSFRLAIKRRLSWCVDDLRRLAHWRPLADRWLELRPTAAAASHWTDYSLDRTAEYGAAVSTGGD